MTQRPSWGAAEDLLAMLDLHQTSVDTFESVVRGRNERAVVEGSQLLAQASVAACRLAPGRRPVSAHLISMRSADTEQPLTFAAETLSAGRTYTTIRIEIRQGDRHCATSLFLMDVLAPDLIRHEIPSRVLLGPDAAMPFDMAVAGRSVRIVDDAYNPDPDGPTGPPTIDAWVRFDQPPGDVVLRNALLLQFLGHLSVATPLRPHRGVGERDAHSTLSTAPMAFSLSMHRNAPHAGWWRYHLDSTFAGDGTAYVIGQVIAESGELIASWTVEVMARSMLAAGPALDRSERL